MNVEDMLVSIKDRKGKKKREITENARFDARKRTSQFLREKG